MTSSARRPVLLGLACTLIGAAGNTAEIRLTMATALGDVGLILSPGRAPLSCAAFLACVDAGLYTGGHFTRVVRPDNDPRTPKINVVQGAASRDVETSKPVPHEGTRTTGLRHVDGTVSLPRDAPGTATGAEFFICVGDNAGLDEGGLRNPDLQGFAAFGRVVTGMATVRQVWGMDASGPSDSPYTARQMLLHPYPILGVRRLA